MVAGSGEVGALPDLVWVVRPPATGETSAGSHAELRYSLRSFVKNARGLYRKVWVVGTVPAWVSDRAGKIPLPPKQEKWANIRQSIEAVCADDRVADQIVVMNDDFFAVDRVEGWEAHHLGPMSAYLRFLSGKGTTPQRNSWARCLERTAAWLRDALGVEDPNCYECHTPLLFDRRRLGELLAQAPAEWITYAGLYPVAGAAGVGSKAINTKVAATDAATLERKLAAPIPYVSSNEKSFDNGVVGGFIRGMFRTPCKYEQEVS